MDLLFNLLITGLLLLDFRLLYSARLMPCVTTVALQAVVFTLLALLMNLGHLEAIFVALLLANILLKAVLLPWVLRRAASGENISRELEPIVGHALSLLIGGGMFVAAFYLAGPMEAHIHGAGNFLPATLFTVFCGLFMVCARRKAVTQILGFMALENGIYGFGLAVAPEESFLLEIGTLLDLFAAIMITGVVIFHIHREFNHIDTTCLRELKES